VIGFHITTENGFTIWHTGSILPSPKVEELRKLAPKIKYVNPILGKTYQVNLMVKEE